MIVDLKNMHSWSCWISETGFNRMSLMKVCWMLITIHISESLAGRYWYRKSSNLANQCRCNYTEIYTELPYVLQELGRNENFDWIFQGKKGDRGADGPEGPAGLPGRSGKDGTKGEKGEPGLRGLPGTSLVFNPKGSFLGSEPGEKGSIGPRGPNGRKGQKGEPGTTFTTVLKDGGYIQVKGDKGDRGSRGRKGQKGEAGPTGSDGKPGLSIEGQKGNKGEPAEIPDIELLRGLPGPRGPPGLPGYPGIGCHERFRNGDVNGRENSCKLTPIVVQRKGEKGEPGHPGLSITGEKGDAGPQGPPGSPATIPKSFIGTSFFVSKREMLSQKQVRTGSIGFVAAEDRAYIKLPTGWKEILLSSFITDASKDADEQFLLKNSEEPKNGVYDSAEHETSPKIFFLRNPSTEKRRYWKRNPSRVKGI